ncbi:MAG: hypothetical protein E7261_08560 [Lachnospiraceae bacterium]|nr:hypothetical protein [Lachnospiraceae bacterium]
MVWILLVLFYGLSKGAREVMKKKALQKNSVIEVLVAYTVLSFVFVAPTAGQAMGLEGKWLFWIAVKSFVIFVAWIVSFKAIEKMPISIYGVLDLSRVLFSTFLGVIILKEEMTAYRTIGLVFVIVGLLMLKYKKKEKNISTEAVGAKAVGTVTLDAVKRTDSVAMIYVFFAILSCILNAVSGTMDKVLMKHMTTTQLQFWYMLFLVIYYLMYMFITRVKVNWKALLKNYWIIVLSVLFVLADKALFIANGIEESRVTVMTLIKQSGCIMTILGGKFVFHEKNIGYKLVCAGIVIVGIMIGVVGS